MCSSQSDMLKLHFLLLGEQPDGEYPIEKFGEKLLCTEDFELWNCLGEVGLPKPRERQDNLCGEFVLLLRRNDDENGYGSSTDKRVESFLGPGGHL